MFEIKWIKVYETICSIFLYNLVYDDRVSIRDNDDDFLLRFRRNECKSLYIIDD